MGSMLTTALLCAWPVIGCSEDSFSIKVSKPPKERPDLGDDVLSQGPVKLPSGVAFNLTSNSSNENGKCHAQAKADPDGKASAKVTAEEGGAGSAEFQMGYTFDQTAKQPLGAVIELTVDLDEGIELGSGDIGSTAKVTVMFLVKDSNGSTLRSESLLADSSASGARRWSARTTTAIDAVFVPDLGYYVLVAARVEATGAAGRKASADLAMKSCEMTIRWKKESPVARGETATKPATATR